MKHTWRAKILSTAIAACLAFSSMPAFADGTKQIKVTLTNVTATDAATQYGEAKIKVSISGADGNISAVQNAFTFEGLDYKNVQFLKGENNPPECIWVSPDKAKANADKKFSVGIAAPGGIAFGDNEEVYIITFSGEPGKKVTLDVADGTFCVTDGGSKITASAEGTCEAAASAKENKSIDAVIKLTMDKITGFNAAAETGITLKITNQTTKGYMITDILSNKAVQEGGHRESTDIPTFTVKNSVLAGDKYTVELYGVGYVTYKKTDVTFDKPLEITNADFVPGDVNDDGKVDADDKALAEKSKNGDYNEAADFDRNGKTDLADMKVFDGISDKTVPAKMTAPTVTGGSKKITVKWTKPTDESITGYTIKYGTNKDKLTSTKEIDKADTVNAEITGLSASTAYYLQIAAKNASGTGEYSDIANAKTDSDSTQGGGGTGGSGGSSGGFSGGGFSGGGATTPGTTTQPSTTETFTDLENHAWAKDAIYTLKNKGIISGISDTEFAPANNIKRGDFILILTKMLSVNDTFTENFADVPESAYYYNAVGSAKAAGIAQGSGENFMPENSITRQDLITLAYRAFLAKGYITETDDTASLDAFADKDDISDYAGTAMASMVKADIIQGSNGNVNPKGFATRAEVAVMCARLCELMK